MSETLTLTFEGSAIREAIDSIIKAIRENSMFSQGVDDILETGEDPFDLKWEGLEAKAFVSPRLAALMAAHGVSP